MNTLDQGRGELKRGAEAKGQLWVKTLWARALGKMCAFPGVWLFNALAHRKLSHGAMNVEGSGWLADPSPHNSALPHQDHTYVLRGQELHAIGHLVAEAHEVCVAEHW